MSRVAVVTGGSAGIGFAIAKVLMKRGHRVAIAARNKDRLAAAQRHLQNCAAQEIVAIPADTTDQGQVDELMETVLHRFGKLEVLINCAANPSGIAATIEEAQTDILLDDLNTKVVGYIRCVKAVAVPMKTRRYGRVINIGGLTGRGSDTLSGLRNVAVSHLTKRLADELGPFGITVNAIHPGIVRTQHLDELFKSEAAKLDTSAEEIEASFISRIPIRRLLEPEEIGAVVAFLVSEDAAGINGESIAVDGGFTRGIYL